MPKLEVTLSLARKNHMGINDISEDFVFVVDDKRYSAPRIIAHLLSSIVCLQHGVDPSITEYFVQTKDLTEQFQLFMSLGDGSPIEVAEANRVFFLNLFREFGDTELLAALLHHIEGSFPLSQIFDLFADEAPGFIASQFHRLNTSDLGTIPVSALYHILSQNALTISSEDSLYRFISSRLSEDPEFWSLFEFVRFEYLSLDCILEFASISRGCIDHRLWSALFRRLTFPIEVLYGFDENEPLVGIIAYLTREHGGNVSDKGVVAITSKSLYSAEDYPLQSVADLESAAYFVSRPEPDQWICWDFQTIRVRPFHYTLKNSFMRSWVVERSLNGVNWVEIDRHAGQIEENKWIGCDTFPVSNSGQCRFIRLTQTDTNYIGNTELSLGGFEVFGTLSE
jgi:hypothetical protein